MDQLVATAPAATADVDTRVSLTFDPAAFPSRPGTAAEAITEVGRTLPGMESALGACGVAVLARARAAWLPGRQARLVIGAFARAGNSEPLDPQDDLRTWGYKARTSEALSA